MSGLVIDQALNDRLVATYRTAIEQQRTGARVEIHAGVEVIEALKAIAVTKDERLLMMGPRLWGFPVVEEPAGATLHLSVHTVHTIA